jgi:hypothetical protein
MEVASPADRISPRNAEDKDDDEEEFETIVEAKDNALRRRIAALKHRQSDVTIVRIPSSNNIENNLALDAPSSSTASMAGNQPDIDSTNANGSRGNSVESGNVSINADRTAYSKQSNSSFCRVLFDEYIKLEPTALLRGQDYISVPDKSRSQQGSSKADDKSLGNYSSGGAGKKEESKGGRSTDGEK